MATRISRTTEEFPHQLTWFPRIRTVTIKPKPAGLKMCFLSRKTSSFLEAIATTAADQTTMRFPPGDKSMPTIEPLIAALCRDAPGTAPKNAHSANIAVANDTANTAALPWRSPPPTSATRTRSANSSSS